MQEHKLGTTPLAKLLITMSFPIMITMCMQSMYGVIDSIYISQIGENALAAVSLASQVQSLMASVANGLALAVSTIISKNLGERDKDGIKSTIAHGFFLAGICMVAFFIFGVFGTKSFYGLQVEVGSEMYNYCVDYQSITFVFSIGLFGQAIVARLMQSTGKASLSLVTQLVGLIFNLILDPLLIHGYWIFPKLEVQGAAIATVLGQTFAFIIGLIINNRYNKEVKIDLKGFKMSIPLVKKICGLAIPTSLNLSTTTITGIFMSNFVLSYGTSALAVFGSYNKLQSFVFMPVNAIKSALIPIIAYSYGAKNKKRLITSYYYALIAATLFLSMSTFIFQMFPATLLGIYETTDTMLAIGVPMIKKISLFYLFACFSSVFNSLSQGLVKSQYSLYITMVKQFTILPLAFIFSTYGDINLFWYCYVISEAITMCSALGFFKHLYKTKIKHLGENENEQIQATNEKSETVSV